MAARIPQQLPNMFAPTLDVNELEKRIADLRAVEQWLELNASILRTTIQSLEVQRATIATLKGISGAMLASDFQQGRRRGEAAPPAGECSGLAAMKAEESKAAASSAASVSRRRQNARKSPTRRAAQSLDGIRRRDAAREPDRMVDHACRISSTESPPLPRARL